MISRKPAKIQSRNQSAGSTHMDFDGYQSEAAQTERKDGGSNSTTIALLGLAGEAGSLLTLYKKWFRDGDAYQLMRDRLKEELGDILWYLAAVARKNNIRLSDVAASNLEKVRSRWLYHAVSPIAFDETYGDNERLPRTFTADILDFPKGNKQVTELRIDGTKVGDNLTDNAYSDDGYRFHDVFHLSYAVLLGWSPVLRSNMEHKRKSNKLIDEVEDGGRAIAIEEGISALVFNYAEKHSFLEGITTIDWAILRTCTEMTGALEVGARSLYEWEQAIISGYQVWRKVREHGGGKISCDLFTRKFEYIG